MSIECSTFAIRRAPGLGALLLALVGVGLLLAPTARAAEPIVISPITVSNGSATVSGSVDGSALPESFTINGQPVTVGANGQFGSVIDLNGQSDLRFSFRNPATGESSAITIPLNVGNATGGVIPTSVLDQLRQAGASVTVPQGGFTILDSLPLIVQGRVADPEQLAGLKVNGTDVLGSTKPDGTFSTTVPGTTRELVVTATDKQGITQTSRFDVARESSVLGTQAGKSISAAGARGVRIAGVRYLPKGAGKTKRVRMIVTINDKRGYFIRDAIVRIRPRQPRFVVGGQQARLTGKTGRANFLIRLRPKALGKRLFVVSFAVTPSARTQKVTSVKLPRAVKRGTAL